MENPKIVIQRTKEELRTYNIFSAIQRSVLRRTLQYIIPILGLVQLGLYFLVVNNVFNLAVGAFLIIYPFLSRYQVIKASDRAYDTNNLSEYKINVTFNNDNFTTESNVVGQKIYYNEIYKIYNRKNDLIIYTSINSGLYISKTAYPEETIVNIIDILKQAVPEKF